jgi:carbon storage regulator
MEGDMLVLTRKPGEGIVIGDDIKITFIETKGAGIRIGIEAPAGKKIYRQEIYDRICLENREASQWNLADLDMLTSAMVKKESL